MRENEGTEVGKNSQISQFHPLVHVYFIKTTEFWKSNTTIVLSTLENPQNHENFLSVATLNFSTFLYPSLGTLGIFEKKINLQL
jgi:hypothetical protein